MSGFFNFLKNLFSGLLGLVGLGSKTAEAGGQPKPAKRSGGYFLELDEATGVSSPAAKPATPAATPVAVAQPAAAKVEAKPQAKPAPVATVAPTPAAPAKPAPAAQALNLPKPTVTFASTYLAPGNGSSGRRRPGANMTSYLDMAKQVKPQG
jgi:hypothetical protein